MHPPWRVNSMNPLDHFPEPFSPTGNMASEGVLNQLGRPQMGPLEVLVREAIQNCWDAKAAGSQQVRVGIHLVELTEIQGQALAEQFFRDGPPTGDTGKALRRSRRLLLISDRGTSGLGGVLRADREEGDEPRDFVDFVRNVGQPPDKDRGGGTYGYGKVALYLASTHRTLIIHTRCRHRGRNQTRLIAARLGAQYSYRDRRYTGRHWWGRVADDGTIDPVLDRDATVLAESIGLPQFDEYETGSTIAIVEPDFGELDDQRAMELIGNAIAWNFWPKMVGMEGSPPSMTFSLTAFGDPVSVPDPSAHPVLRAFREAFRTLKAVASGGAHVSEPGMETGDIACGKPIQHLGIVSLVKVPMLNPPEDIEQRTDDEARDDQPRPGLEGRPVHHAALLRAPELVVQYLPGPESPTPTIGYAGVFLAHDGMDRIYAKSEPPTHDDWIPDGVSDRHHKTFIRVTKRRLVDAMREFTGIVPSSPSSTEGAPLGALAEQLRGLLPGIEGPGARTPDDTRDPPRPRPERDGRPRPRVTLDGDPELEMRSGRAAVTVTGTVRVPAELGSAIVRARPYVVLESGAPEKEPPAGAESPEILGWRNERGEVVHGATDLIRVEGEGEHVFAVSASVPEDAHVGIEITSSAEQE
jgi:hypothetical protein